jgi:hypothetical protein
MLVFIRTLIKPIGKNLLLKVLNKQYTSSKKLIAIFKIKEKELLVVIKLLNITINGPNKIKGIENTVYPLKVSYILK